MATTREHTSTKPTSDTDWSYKSTMSCPDAVTSALCRDEIHRSPTLDAWELTTERVAQRDGATRDTALGTPPHRTGNGKRPRAAQVPRVTAAVNMASSECA